jgi:hypothetical protein
MKKFIYSVLSLLFILLISGCSTFNSILNNNSIENSLDLAKELNKDSSLSIFTTGSYYNYSTDAKDYYEHTITWINENIDSWETEEDIAGITGAEAIATHFVNNMDSITDSSYVGIEGEEYISGIFIYNHSTPPSITAEQIDAANTIANYNGEAYYVSGNYIITIDYNFMNGNLLDFDKIVELIDNTLNK